MKLLTLIAREIRTKFQPSHYTPSQPNLEGHLEGIDSAIGNTMNNAKEFYGFVMQSGTNAPMFAGVNTTGLTFTFGYGGVGIYTLAAPNIGALLKHITVTPIYTGTFFVSFLINESNIEIYTRNSAGNLANGELNHRIYITLI